MHRFPFAYSLANTFAHFKQNMSVHFVNMSTIRGDFDNITDICKNVPSCQELNAKLYCEKCQYLLRTSISFWFSFLFLQFNRSVKSTIRISSLNRQNVNLILRAIKYPVHTCIRIAQENDSKGNAWNAT